MNTDRGPPPGVLLGGMTGNAAVGFHQKGIAMPPPEQTEKEYLELATAGEWVFIEGLAQHIAALEALLHHRSVRCTRGPSGLGNEVLRLAEGADRAAAREVLDSYKAARGS